MTLKKFTQEKYWMSIKAKCEEVWISYNIACKRRSRNRDKEDIYMPSFWHWWVRKYTHEFYSNYQWDKCNYYTYCVRIYRWQSKELAILPIKTK